MKKIYYHTKTNSYGIIDESQSPVRIYWINEDLSPIWSNYVYRQKSMCFSDIEHEMELVFELDFEYLHVTDLQLSASLD